MAPIGAMPCAPGALGSSDDPSPDHATCTGVLSPFQLAAATATLIRVEIKQEQSKAQATPFSVL